MFAIPAKLWNEKVVAKLRKTLPFKVREIGSRKWKHPFKHSLRWDGEAWLLQVNPGFLNANPVEVTTSGRYISPDSMIKHTVQNDEQEVQLPITEYPEVQILDWRAIGSGADPLNSSVNVDGNVSEAFEPVPEFFLNQGVVEETRNIDASFASGIAVTEGERPQDARLLRAFDTYIEVPRLETVVDWSFGTVLEATLATFTISYKEPEDDTAVLFNTSKFTPLTTPSEIDLLAGIFNDQNKDQLKLATVYFLSLPGADPGDDLDDTWTPFVSHDVFFNLSHKLKTIPEPTKVEPITLQTGLAGGIADPIIGGLLAQNNDLFNSAQQIYNARSTGGSFWSI